MGSFYIDAGQEVIGFESKQILYSRAAAGFNSCSGLVWFGADRDMVFGNPLEVNTVRKGEWLQITYRPRAGNPPAQEGEADIIGSGEAPTAEECLIRLGIPPKLRSHLLRTEGVRCQGNRTLVRLFPEESCGYEPEWLPLEVLYEDDYCLVVNKPAGLPVHPQDKGGLGTLANAVAAYYESTGQACRVRHIHRLDEDTTGPVLYAKNEYAQSILDAAMRSRDIRRFYVALVEGRIHPDKGTISAPIGRDRHHAKRRRVSSTGQPAVTRYETIDRCGTASLLRLELVTGRTHQIRVHLSYKGHPIIGDALYGTADSLISRQALHGQAIYFPHPLTGEIIQAEAPLPDDFLTLIQARSHS